MSKPTPTPPQAWTRIAREFDALAADPSAFNVLFYRFGLLEMRAAKMCMSSIAAGLAPKCWPDSMEKGCRVRDLRKQVDDYERKRGAPVKSLMELRHPNGLRIGEPLPVGEWTDPPGLCWLLWREDVVRALQAAWPDSFDAEFVPGMLWDAWRSLPDDLREDNQRRGIQRNARVCATACDLLSEPAQWVDTVRSAKPADIKPNSQEAKMMIGLFLAGGHVSNKKDLGRAQRAYERLVEIGCFAEIPSRGGVEFADGVGGQWYERAREFSQGQGAD